MTDVGARGGAATALITEGERISPTQMDRPRLIVLSACHFINDSYAYYLPVLIPFLMATHNISLAMASLVYGVYQITSSFTQPLMGHLSDLRNRRWYAYGGIALGGIAVALLGVAPAYWSLVVLAGLGGLGAATFHPVAAAMANAVSGQRKGAGVSLYLTAGNIGLAAGPLVVGVVLDHLGLPFTYLLALPAIVGAVLLFTHAPSAWAPRRSSGTSMWTDLRQHGDTMAKLLAVVVLRSWAAFGPGAFLPVLFVSRGLSASTGAAMLSVVLFFGAMGGLLGGQLSDMLGRNKVILVSLLAAPPFLLYMLHGVGPAQWIAAALAGLFLNGSFVVLTVKAQEVMPRSVGLASGLMLGLSVGIGGMSVGPMAALAETFGLAAVLNVASFSPFLAAAVMATVRSREPQGAEAVR